MKQESHIAEEREKLFEVVKLKLHSGIEGYDAEDAYGMFRKDGGKSLGIVGRVFEPTQSTFLFDGFVDCVQELPNVDLSSLTVKHLKEGRRVMIGCDIGSFAFTNLVGKDDMMKVRLNVQTGFDGTTTTQLFLSTFRLICSNGMKGWATDVNLSFKNTAGNIGKANVMCADIAKVMKGQGNYLDNLKHLSLRKVTQSEQNAYIRKVTGIDPTKTDLSTQSKNILTEINKTVAIETKYAGQTAWAILNGITRYTNHIATAKDRDSYLYADRGAILNANAQKYAFEMFN